MTHEFIGLSLSSHTNPQAPVLIRIFEFFNFMTNYSWSKKWQTFNKSNHLEMLNWELLKIANPSYLIKWHSHIETITFYSDQRSVDFKSVTRAFVVKAGRVWADRRTRCRNVGGKRRSQSGTRRIVRTSCCRRWKSQNYGNSFSTKVNHYLKLQKHRMNYHIRIKRMLKKIWRILEQLKESIP